MRKGLFFIALLIPVSAKAELTSFWVSNGGYKVPQDDLPPSTTNYNWNGSTATTFGAQNETVSLVLFIGNNSGANVSSVTVEMSSFTGTDPDGIVSVEVSSGNVWNMVGRPIQQFYVRYVPIQGLTQLSWDATEYDQGHLPPAFRRACTVSGNGQCIANEGTEWTDRQDANKHYPDILVPWEAVKFSSFTVYQSSSQAVWFDVYLDKNLEPGDYRSEIVVREGVTVSTRIPVALTVYNFELPDVPSLKAIAVVSDFNVSFRHHGERFPNIEAEPYRTTRSRYYQMLHAHSISPIADDRVSADSPYPKDVARLNGTLYSATTGYYGRGADTGDHTYSVGTYGSWQGAWGTTVASTFCGHVANWQEYFRDNFPSVNAFLYLADETLDSGNVEKWATWMSTVTACQTSNYVLNSWVTFNWPTVQTDAPHVNMPATTGWMGVPAADWDVTAANYLTQGTTQGWHYNSHPPHMGSVYATEETGIAPVTIFWAQYKKGVQGWLGWETTYFNDSNNDDKENFIWGNALTFGLYTSDNAIKGRTGFQYANGDGLLMYPGTDLAFSTQSYTIQAPFASWRLKMLRRGIQDGDYLTMARLANQSTVNSAVNALVPTVMWEYECFDEGDCTFGYGERDWPEDLENYDRFEQQREVLAQLLDGFEPRPKSMTGRVTLTGTATLR